MKEFWLMNKVKLLAIAPYEGLAEILRSISMKRDDVMLTIEVGDLSEGVQLAKKHADENFDAIISRGGTAELLRAAVEIPVIEISISVYDVLRAIKMAELYDARFAVVGFSTITERAKLLSDLLQYKLDIITFESEEDVEPILRRLKDHQYDLVVSDRIGSTVAEEIGLNSILISSGNESAASSFNRAIQLVQSLRPLHKEKEIFKQISTSHFDNFLIYNEKGKLWFSHITASDYHDTIFSTVNDYLEKLTTFPNQKFEIIVDHFLFTITNDFYFHNDEQFTLIKITKKDAPLIQEDVFSIYNLDSADQTIYDDDYSSANFIGMVRKQIEEYSRTHLPILIIGESGTGKEKAASIIYKKGPFNNNPLYTIDCATINEQQWNSLLSHYNSPLYNVQTTIYFKEIIALDPKQFNKLFEFFSQSNLAQRNRLIFSATLNDTLNNDEIIHSLKYKLSCLQLFLPALRERISDLPSILALYINKLNTSMGKQIIGFEQEALEFMKEFTWENNLDQLHRVLRELVILAEGSYISKDLVKKILSQETRTSMVNPPKVSSIPLNKTLDEINYYIIQAVLEEEGQNKESTAKRLGISRSTLWRKINSAPS